MSLFWEKFKAAFWLLGYSHLGRISHQTLVFNDNVQINSPSKVLVDIKILPLPANTKNTLMNIFSVKKSRKLTIVVLDINHKRFECISNLKLYECPHGVSIPSHLNPKVTRSKVISLLSWNSNACYFDSFLTPQSGSNSHQLKKLSQHNRSGPQDHHFEECKRESELITKPLHLPIWGVFKRYLITSVGTKPKVFILDNPDNPQTFFFMT